MSVIIYRNAEPLCLKSRSTACLISTIYFHGYVNYVYGKEKGCDLGNKQCDLGGIHAAPPSLSSSHI